MHGLLATADRTNGDRSANIGRIMVDISANIYHYQLTRGQRAVISHVMQHDTTLAGGNNRIKGMSTGPTPSKISAELGFQLIFIAVLLQPTGPQRLFQATDSDIDGLLDSCQLWRLFNHP